MIPPSEQSRVIRLPRQSGVSRAGTSSTSAPGRVVQGRFGAAARAARGSDASVRTGDEAVRVPRVLVVDGDVRRAVELGELFEDLGYDTFEATDAIHADAWFRHLGEVDVVVLDLNLPQRGAFELMARSGDADTDQHRPEFVVLARREQRSLALEALHAGAFDWQESPIDIAVISHAVARATEQVRLRRVDRLFQYLLNHSL